MDIKTSLSIFKNPTAMLAVLGSLVRGFISSQTGLSDSKTKSFLMKEPSLK